MELNDFFKQADKGLNAAANKADKAFSGNADQSKVEKIFGAAKRGLSGLRVEVASAAEDFSDEIGFKAGKKISANARRATELKSTDKLHEKAYLKVKHIFEKLIEGLTELCEKHNISIEGIIDALTNVVDTIKSTLGIVDKPESKQHRNAAKNRDTMKAKYQGAEH